MTAPRQKKRAQGSTDAPKPDFHKLTEQQRTRVALRVAGATPEEIAQLEGVTKVAIYECLARPSAREFFLWLMDVRDQAAVMIGATRLLSGKPLDVKQLLDRVVEQAQQGLTARPRGRPPGSKNRRPRRRRMAGQWGPKPATSRATDSAREGTQAYFDDNCGDNDSE